ncbi:GGDEF domain-containing protein [Sandaracinobacteroides saxicola]|uniref:diguanylate cyclase n=1 Tax=Sandaracinobacteroides saxicola TaxID=2759707 RepID=A0A7G5IIX2_9SPHN|nr:GGDEF domain-containing protein [Sandaracinobacteroides saxicola]QMW23314.1 GGDEF domain-containing protein [Sandaracinobacteroides saxicola]
MAMALAIAFAVKLFLVALFFGVRAARRWRRQALSDPLTGLPNRRALDAALARAAPGLALLFIDVDRFKAVNDARGHAAGDALLLALTATWPRGDFIARYGGDEFVALVPAARAGALAQGLLVSARSAGATLSIGRAEGDAATLLLRADRALALAKVRGGDRVVADSPAIGLLRVV